MSSLEKLDEHSEGNHALTNDIIQVGKVLGTNFNQVRVDMLNFKIPIAWNERFK